MQFKQKLEKLARKNPNQTLVTSRESQYLTSLAGKEQKCTQQSLFSLTENDRIRFPKKRKVFLITKKDSIETKSSRVTRFLFSEHFSGFPTHRTFPCNVSSVKETLSPWTSIKWVTSRERDCTICSRKNNCVVLLYSCRESLFHNWRSVSRVTNRHDMV